MTLLYAILGGFLRVWFGSDLESKLWSNRGLQTFCMIVALMTIFIADFTNPYCWIFGLVISCWVQFEFFSRGHGEVADCGRHKYLSDDDIARYNDRWYHIPCDFILPNHKYEFLYDFIYLTLRYTCPMLLMAILDWRFLLIGLSIAPIYAFSMTLEEREAWLFLNEKWYWRRGWSLAEILLGAVTYGGGYWICQSIWG